ncbi:MAG: MraY family glycosyltransferase [Candidatus Omnitrophica bacterium]|nr:MraY family glycosyltransferase [Candidatus Omnitrophota bacterium]
MRSNYFIVFMGGLIISALFIFLFRKISLKFKLLLSQGMPLVGGLGIGASFIICCLLLTASLPREMLGIITCAYIILIFGVVDDWRELSIIPKFLVQFIAASLLILFGVKTQIVYIGNLMNILVTLIWIIGITNAFNLLDIMDGLAAGVALISASGLLLIAFFNHDVNSMFFLSMLIGSILGFLIYNLPPAKVYLGNCGSHFLGFIIAAITLIISYAPMDRKVALISPLLVLGFPIFDIAFLILIRIKNKKIPFKKSKDHLALRFLAIKYSNRKALVLMLVLAVMFSASGVLISRSSNILGSVIAFFMVLVGLIIAVKMSKVEVQG